MRKELEEQYHPKENSFEYKRDKYLKWLRHLAMPAFFAIGILLLAITSLSFLEVGSVLYKTSNLFDNAYAYLSGDSQNRSLVDRQLLNQVISSILSVLDLLLLTSLVVMVLIGGFENTIGRIGMTHNVPTWFGRLDITDLKIKVAASIVIISSIHLLTQFMFLDVKPFDGIGCMPGDTVTCSALTTGVGNGSINLENMSALANGLFSATYSTDALMWTAIIHIVFVVSAIALAYMAKMGEHNKHMPDLDASKAYYDRKAMEAEKTSLAAARRELAELGARQQAEIDKIRVQINEMSGITPSQSSASETS